ncbi:MAG TPA: hypothetical protein VG710_10260 [Opitutus sp.]|nr:hypothetical protein [Opitutus sp.]
MSPRKTNVTLEDLLRVKRAERPPVGFWNDFEREMRAKELAAIVEPRPWWAPLIRVGARVSRHQLPIGAAAILALSFVTVREYRTYELNTISGELAAREAMNENTALFGRAASAAKLAMARPVMHREEARPATAVATDAALRAATGQRSHTESVAVAPAKAEPTPSARYIAANLAALQAADPRLIEEAFGVRSHRSEDVEPMRDPLAQISMPGESRRSRLLSTSLPVMATSVSVGSSDRVARRLTEDRLYDSISRVGVRGDRVAIKF